MCKKLRGKIKEKHLISRYVILLLHLFIAAICYNLLLYPAKIVAGGANGLSIIIESIAHIPPSNFILVFSVIVLIISFFVLGIEKSSGAVIATLVYPIFVDLTSGITTIIDMNRNDVILISIFAGILNGWTSGMIYKTGFSSGGISLINQMLYEKLKISISKTNFLINMIIVIIGGIYYGIENIMYAIIVLYISSTIINRVLLGISKNKVFYMITNHDDEIKQYLLTEVGHGITEFDVVSGYLGKKDQVLMAVVPTRDYTRIKEKIKIIDPNIFFIVADSYESLNGS